MRDARTVLPMESMARAEDAVAAGRWTDALAAYAAAARRAEPDPSGLALRSDAWRGSAGVRMRLGQWEEAVRDAAESREAAGRIGDDRRLALVENLHGEIEFERGNWNEAGRRYAVARECAGTADDDALLLEIEHNDGVLWAALGDRERAEESFRWALTRCGGHSGHPAAARVLGNLGMVLVAGGRHEEADAVFEEALAECKRRGDLRQGARVMVHRARLALVQNDVLRAHALATTAHAFCDNLKDATLAASASCVLGGVARRLGRWDEAEERLRRALSACTHGRSPLGEAEVWAELAELEAGRSRRPEALAAWTQARRCYLALGARLEAERIAARARELEEDSVPASKVG